MQGAALRIFKRERFSKQLTWPTVIYPFTRIKIRSDFLSKIEVSIRYKHRVAFRRINIVEGVLGEKNFYYFDF